MKGTNSYSLLFTCFSTYSLTSLSQTHSYMLSHFRSFHQPHFLSFISSVLQQSSSQPLSLNLASYIINLVKSILFHQLYFHNTHSPRLPPSTLLTSCTSFQPRFNLTHCFKHISLQYYKDENKENMNSIVI